MGDWRSLESLFSSYCDPSIEVVRLALVNDGRRVLRDRRVTSRRRVRQLNILLSESREGLGACNVDSGYEAHHDGQAVRSDA